MIILKQTDLAQNIYATIYGTSADKIILIDEETKQETSIGCVFSIDKYYAVTSVVLDLKEYKFYTLKIYDTDNLVYKGMIFCTNQTVKDYTINKDVYTQNESNNDYIIFD